MYLKWCKNWAKLLRHSNRKAQEALISRCIWHTIPPSKFEHHPVSGSGVDIQCRCLIDTQTYLETRGSSLIFVGTPNSSGVSIENRQSLGWLGVAPVTNIHSFWPRVELSVPSWHLHIFFHLRRAIQDRHGQEAIGRDGGLFPTGIPQGFPWIMITWDMWHVMFRFQLIHIAVFYIKDIIGVWTMIVTNVAFFVFRFAWTFATYNQSAKFWVQFQLQAVSKNRSFCSYIPTLVGSCMLLPRLLHNANCNPNLSILMVDQIIFPFDWE